MKNELMNFVNNIGYWRFCFVTKIKKCDKNESNFNLQHKTYSHPAYALHKVHSSRPRKTEKRAGFVAETLKRHVLTGFFDEHYVVLLTHMMASRIFAHPATGCISAGVNTREDSVFEVHSK
ncbi:MAG: hypothetical protein WC837_04510 [Bellilinea sp.]